MKILLTALKEGVPSAVSETYDPKTLEIEFVDLHYLRPLTLEGTVEKGADTLTFRGQLKTEAEKVCARCLQPAKNRITKDFEFYYEIQGKEEIDTIDDIREIFILDHPLSYICKESCKGLCPQCGTNLNETKCRCKNNETPVKPLAGLAKLKERLENKNKQQRSQ